MAKIIATDMINHYTLFHDPGLARVTFTHIDDLTDIRQLFESLFTDWRYVRSPVPVLVDLMHVTNLPFGIDDIEQLVGWFAEWHVRGLLPRMAILSARDSVFGISRMWELIKDTQTSLQSAVFRDHGQALQWLLAPLRSSASSAEKSMP